MPIGVQSVVASVAAAVGVEVVVDDSPTQLEVECSTCWIADPSIVVGGLSLSWPRPLRLSLRRLPLFSGNLVEDEGDRHGDVGAQCHYSTHHTSMVVEVDGRNEDEVQVVGHNEDDRVAGEVAGADDTQEDNAEEGKVADNHTTFVEADRVDSTAEVVDTWVVVMGVVGVEVVEDRCHWRGEGNKMTMFAADRVVRRKIDLKELAPVHPAIGD